MVIALFYEYFLFLNLFYVDVIVRKNEGTLIFNLLTSSALLLTLMFAVFSESAEKKGEALFIENCAECHQRNGKGIVNVYPSLAGNELVVGSGADVALVLIIGRGEMPSFNEVMTSTDMANVVNYVRNSFGNKGKLISEEVIESFKQ